MSAYLPYIIVFFAVALIVGPVMMIKPSARQTRVANLRGMAARKGLLVKVSELKSPQGNVLMEYMLPRSNADVAAQNKGDAPMTEWTLLRHKTDHEGYYYQCWHWHANSDAEFCRQFEQGTQRKRVQDFIDGLPAGIFSIGNNRVGAVLSWSEAIADVDEQTAVDQIVASLQALSGIQV